MNISPTDSRPINAEFTTLSPVVGQSTGKEEAFEPTTNTTIKTTVGVVLEQNFSSSGFNVTKSTIDPSNDPIIPKEQEPVKKLQDNTVKSRLNSPTQDISLLNIIRLQNNETTPRNSSDWKTWFDLSRYTTISKRGSFQANKTTSDGTTTTAQDGTIMFENKFENAKYRLVAATHGLSFVNYGRAYIFPEVWDQFIKFEVPQNLEIKKEFHQKNCEEELNGAIDIVYNKIRANNFADITYDLAAKADFKKIVLEECKNLNHHYDKIILEMQDVLNEAFEAFQRKIRSKREPITIGLVLAGSLLLGTTIGSAIGSYFGSKHAVDDLKNEIQLLETEMRTMGRAVALNSKYLIGLSEKTAKLEGTMNEKIKNLAETTRDQIKTIEGSMKIMIELHQLSDIKNEYMRQIRDYINSHISSMRNIIDLQFDRIYQWERIFTDLRKGLLPLDLISYNDLRTILNEIKDRLPREVEFGINEKDLALYYFIPLVSYIVLQNNGTAELYVHFKIPLKHANTINEYMIYAPNAKPFPCQGNQCAFKTKTSKEYLQTFNLEQTVHLVNPFNFEIRHEVANDYLICKEGVNDRVCHTFYPTLLTQPTACTLAIHQWNEEQMVEHCPLKLTTRDQYKVIEALPNMYIAHKDIVKSYLTYCGKIDNVQVVKQITNWAQVFKIPKYCEAVVADTRQKLYGPMSDILRGAHVPNQTNYQSTLIQKIFDKYVQPDNTTSPMTKVSTRRIREITEKFQIDTNRTQRLIDEIEAEEMTELQQFHLEVQKKLSDNLDYLSSDLSSMRLKATFWGILNIAGESVQLLSTLILVFGIISYSNLFNCIGASVIIIAPQRVSAWEINLIPDFQLLPKISVEVLSDLAGITFFINIGFVILFVLFFTLFWCFGMFRRVYITRHYGKMTASGMIMCGEDRDDAEGIPNLMIHLHYKGHRFYYIKIENIHIKMSLSHVFDRIYSRIEVKNPFLIFYIHKEEGKFSIRLSEPIALIAFDTFGNRRDAEPQFVDLPIDNTAFNSSPNAYCLKHSGNHGLAYLHTVVPKKRLNKTTIYPRYTELIPSAPIEEATERL